MTLDTTDKKLITLLQQDSKQTTKSLSLQLNLSVTAIYERVKKLEKSGIIKSYHALLDEHTLGLEVSTFVQVTLTSHNKKNIGQFMDAIDQIDEVIECHHITGSGDLLLKIITRDIASYQELILEKISEIEVVDNLQSMVILSTLKNSHHLPLKNAK